MGLTMKTSLVAATIAISLCSPAIAAEYPAHGITFIVPFAAGGPTDTVARAVAGPMSKSLGQPIIIENVAGAGGSVGVGRAVNASPDGYTLNVGNWSTHVVNGAMYTLRYDLLNDLEPVARLPSAHQLIVARKGVAANNLSELVAWMKGRTTLVGTAGVGSASHIGAVLFQSETGARITPVHYRGTAPAMIDLIGGQIDVMFDQAANSLPQIREGAIKAFAVTSAARLQAAPDIPTVDEAGLPHFYVEVWHGLWAPKGTPPQIVAKLNAAALDALGDPLVRERLTALGLSFPDPADGSPTALSALQKSEIAKWWPIVKAANIKGE
jgi:tripartite-type tricarboxylate transporter receptor subunit TctC